MGHTSNQCNANKINCYKCGKDGHLNTQCTTKNKSVNKIQQNNLLNNIV